MSVNIWQLRVGPEEGLCRDPGHHPVMTANGVASAREAEVSPIVEEGTGTGRPGSKPLESLRVGGWYGGLDATRGGEGWALTRQRDIR